jgi:predicted peptidase
MTPEKVTAAPLPYLLYTPETPADARLPLILFLHGAGERGDDLERVRTQGLPQLLPNLPEPTFVVAPQCPASSWWTLELATLETLLDEVQAHHPVDAARVYLTGLSMGGYGTWHLALKDPARFAALAPVCGGGIPSLAHKLRDLPIRAFHGAEDDVVPPAASEKMVEAITKAGGQATFTNYPGVGHNSWARAYAEPDLYTWMFAQRRRG